VYACAQAVDVPIVGLGGIRTGRDALEIVAAGASVVALGTVLLADPGAPSRIRDEIEVEAERLGFPRASEARGVATKMAELQPF
jgi:dihydroorotate dehydrogenase (NAD+) catalytic subunit